MVKKTQANPPMSLPNMRHKDTNPTGRVPTPAMSPVSGSRTPMNRDGAPRHTDTPRAGAVPAADGPKSTKHRPPEGRGSAIMHQDTAPAGRVPNHKAEHNDAGMIRAMHEHADREHPVKGPGSGY